MDPEDLIENDINIEDEEEDDDDDDDETSTDDDDDDDGEDDEDDDDEVEMTDENKLPLKEYELKLGELEQILQANKYQYQTYVDLIKLAKDNIDMIKLREYREKMSDLFPLTENLWLEWLKDEQKLMQTDLDRQKIKNLFEKAIQDYLSVDIWLEYIQFSIGGMNETDGINNVRSICERAIQFAGLHIAKGNILWEAYREFETALLSGYQQIQAGKIQTPEQTKQINDQLDRINKLFKQELNVSLQAGEKTLKEFSEFDETQIDSDLKKSFEKSKQTYKQIESYELALKTVSSEDSNKSLNDYKSYLDFQMKLVSDLEKAKIKQNNKLNSSSTDDDTTAQLDFQRRRLKCLFERAIAHDSNCLDVSLWLKYIHYLNEEEGFIETNESQRDYNLSVAKRSIRNCYWSSKLWINYVILLERTNSTDQVERIKGLFNEALNAGLQTSEDYLAIWHAYLDFLKRLYLKNESNIDELRNYFQKAINQQFDCNSKIIILEGLSNSDNSVNQDFAPFNILDAILNIIEYFKHHGDPTFSLEKYWANVEAKYFKSMDQCRKIYNEMILSKSDYCKYSSVWLEFYDLEREFGDEKHQRKLLMRALNEVSSINDKEIIYDLLIKFEKLNGNIQQYSSIYLKYEQFRLEQEQKKQQQQIGNNKPKKQFNSSETNGQNKKQPQTQSSAAKKPPPQSNVGNNLKRKKSDDSPNEFKQSEPPKKQQVTATTTTTNLKDKDGFVIPNLPTEKKSASVAIPPPPSLTSSKPSNVTSTSSENYKKYSNLTVFISNLSFEVDEARLKTIFEKEPGFKEIRLVKHWSGKSKGYGYVDFETVEQATNALSFDRTLIDGRPLFVSKNEDKSLDFGQNNKLKYAVNLEKNKLFVSGLPFTTESKDLEEIFKTFGSLKEVRIVTYKNGKSKGLAYVEFEDAQSASKALIQTDRMQIGDQQISVAISNPPKRKQTERDLIGFSNSNNNDPTKLATSLGSGSFKTGTPATSSTTNNSFSFMPRSQIIGRKTKLDIKK